MKDELKLIIRKIKNEKTFSGLIIAGLTLSFCVAIVLVCNISFHNSYDRFHPDPDRIYNVYADEVYQGVNDIYGELPLAFGETMKDLFPEVESMTRTKDASDVLVSKDNNSTTLKEDALWVDPSFIDIFQLEFLSGNRSSFLSNPNEVYISKSLSIKLFGDDTSEGRNIIINGENQIVTGVFKDYPYNSHQKFDIILPLEKRIPKDANYNWDSYEFLTYVKLKSGTNGNEFEKKLQTIIADHWVPWLKENYHIDYVFNNENSIKLKLIPVPDIHLRGSFVASFGQESDTSVVSTSLIIAIVLILVAYFNAIGFAISKGKKQLTQLSIKRCLGESKRKLIHYFIAENISYTFIAFFISSGIVFILFKINPHIINELVTIPFEIYLKPISFLFLSILVTSVITGLVVGLFFSKNITKNKYTRLVSYSNFWLNRTMLITQVAASIILLIGISAIYKQLNYITNYDLGIDTKNIVIINHGSRIKNHYEAFKTELKKSPFVEDVSCSNSYPFNWMSTSSYINANSENKTAFPFQYFRIDKDFRKVFDINITNGRWFFDDFPNDANSLIMNEAATKQLGLENPLGEMFYRTDLPEKKYEVIGVVNDFNFKSLHHKVEPLLLTPLKKGDWWRFIEIKGTTSDRKQLITEIEHVWNNVSGSEYMDYTFFDDQIAMLYEKEQRVKKAIGIFSLIAVLISCFGMLGIVLNTTLEKTKEIGIRKVNGARIEEVLVMLNKSIVKWIAFAFVIACPIAWYILKEWLENFAYKTEISWWIFTLAGTIALVIALLTVSWQSWRAASRNPVEALRYE